MKVIFLVFSVMLLLLAGLCLEAIGEDLTIEEMRNKLDNATLISGLNIPKNSISKVRTTKSAFTSHSSVKNKFLLLQQFDSTCGTTSAEMVLHYYGQDVGQQAIWAFGTVYIIEIGTTPQEVEDALDRLGVPASWWWDDETSLDHLKSWVREDRPPIILLRFGLVLHYMVVVGYNNQGDFLLADPNGMFRWMSARDLAFGWSLNAPGLPNEDYGIVDGFEKFFLEGLVPAADVLTGGQNVIVPKAPPNKHFPPNTAVPFYTDATQEFITTGRAVRGGNRFNPTWSTDPWEETFTFTEDIADYRVDGVVPAEVENLGGFEPAFIQGHQKVDNRTVKVWGRISPGRFTKGRIFLFVRGYKEPLYGVKTESATQNKRYYSEWGIGSEQPWHTFTFPGDVLGYTISAGINWADRWGAELVDHYKTGNQVKFNIWLADHKFEKNGITVSVTAHYEPIVLGRFSASSYGGSLSNIPSGDDREIRVTVYSTKGYRMPDVRVGFIDTNDSEIAFSPTSATTDSSGVAKSTMKTGSWGDADFRIEVGGMSKTYTVSVARTLKTHTKKRWFSSKEAPWWRRSKWYTAEKHIDVASWVSIHSYSISKHVPLEDRLTAPYVKNHWRSGNRIHLRIRMREHTFDTNNILVRVHAKYWGSAPSPGAPSAVRVDPETVTTVWQELSQVPSETTLLSNYPNPFNPETWIPYHLSEPADVTLNIYSVDGKVVRHLELGHQAAGFYQSRSRAAYWDGRNAGGEQVASGVFFYTLTAGDFSAIRKMVILK